jgi:uncharacterized membrane protein
MVRSASPLLSSCIPSMGVLCLDYEQYGVTIMLSRSRNLYLILFLIALIVVGSHQTIGSQTSENAYLESLGPAGIIAGLTANLNLIRTYKATFVVSDPNGEDAREYAVGWERVPGSGGGTGIHDKRFCIISPGRNSEAFTSGQYLGIHFAFNGEKAFLCETANRGERKSIRGLIQPTLDNRMVAEPLTLTALSTHFTDSAPIHRVVANGTFVKEGIEMVNGHKCVTIYGEYGYAEPGPWQVKHGPGEYVKLFIDPFSGFMPVRQEWYAVKEVEGKLVRKLFITYSAQLKKCEGGIWFPIAGSYEWQNVKKVLKVKDCSLNIDIPQEEFAITTWPPGTYVEDKVANVSFTIPRPLPDELSGLLDVNTVPEERAEQFENIEKKLAAEATDIMTYDTHVPEHVLHDLEAKRPVRTLSHIRIYATLGLVCLTVGLAFFGLGRLISKRR